MKGGRRVKKHYVFIVVALFIGMVINVLVAWAAYSVRGASWNEMDSFGTVSIEKTPFPGWPGEYKELPFPSEATRGDGMFLTTYVFNDTVNEERSREFYEQPPSPWFPDPGEYAFISRRSVTLTHTRCGWPMRSLSRSMYETSENTHYDYLVPNGNRIHGLASFAAPAQPLPFAFIDRGITFSENPYLPKRASGRRRPYYILSGFPARPLVLGFVANTLFYSLPFLIPLLYSAKRKCQRIKAGYCAKCGYNAIGLERCPECGRARSIAWRGAQGSLSLRS